MIVAWPVTLYIRDVPVAWLPFFAQDIRPGRRSGFLPPRFGVTDIVSTSDNVSRSVTDFGYYLALNDFMDAQASIDWFSGNFTRVNTAFRYKVLKKFLQGNLFASYSFGDRRTVQFRANHQQQITPVTDFRVDANYISNTQVFEEREFDPTFQTQQITSDVGFNHRFSFASINLSARRNQSLGTLRGDTELTLPRLNMTFTPITLFRAPRARAGAFNNMVLSGGFGFTRRSQTRGEADDQLTTDGTVNSSLRIGSFGVSGNASFSTQKTTPFDSLGMAPDPFSATRVNYSAQADYQVDLVGSTTFRPTVSITGSSFRSPNTDDEFISAPSRTRIGATLSTDLYGFLPGFGPFSRIRHKVSPRFNYAYSPAVEVADSLLNIPGFPVSSARQENRLQITLNQTFEAKLREDVQLTEEERALLEGRPLEEDSLALSSEEAAAEDVEGEAGARAGEPETEPAAAPAPEAEVAAAGQEVPTEAGRTVVTGRGEPGPSGAGQVPRRAQQRNVVLLAINSSSLDFDFALEGQPKLVTDRWSHRINSDLLRGLALNLSLDLFKGVGEEREFSPILSELTGSFTFSSARGLGGLLGLGGGGAGQRGDPQRRIRQGVDSRYRLQSFEENPDPRDPGLRGAGPWNLSLTYSLSRRRKEEGGEDRQSLGGVLSLTPTPNWSLSWRTDYNLTDGEFGRHLVTLDRDLHRWVASFVFARSPNGNLIFQMSVALRDAPDLKFDYDQRTLNR